MSELKSITLTAIAAAANVNRRYVETASELDPGRIPPPKYGTGIGDVYKGDNAANEFHGNSGNDIIDARGGNDSLYGDAGNDFIDGGDGADRLYGGTGNDTLLGGAGSDTLYGETGSDFLFGGDGSDVLSGGKGRDSVFGENGDDDLTLEAGGSGLYDGGAGNDVFHVLGKSGTLIGGEGIDTLDLSKLRGYLQNGLVTGATVSLQQKSLGFAEDGSLVVSDFERVIGTNYNDDMCGADNSSDFINGGKGDDILRGSGGSDTLRGGDGDDTYIIGPDANADVFTIKYTSGRDTLVIAKTGKATPDYSVSVVDDDLVLTFRNPGAFYPGKIVVEGGAAAFNAGHFGVALQTEKLGRDGTLLTTIKQTAGAVVLAGGDNMVGGNFDDVLKVRDAVDGSALSTRMTGGNGSDLFVLDYTYSTVTVTDLSFSEKDRIQFRTNTGITSIFDILTQGRQVGNDLIVASTFDGDPMQYIFKNTLKADFLLAQHEGLISFGG